MDRLASLIGHGGDGLFSAVQDMGRQSPGALHVVDGDFDHGSLGRCGSRCYRHVSCNARGDAGLDLCCSGVKDAYTCRALPGLGDSGHGLVLLSPRYRPVVQRRRPEAITVKRWDGGAVGELQSCFGCAGWDMFIEVNPDLGELTDTVGCCVGFCVECVVPQETVGVFPDDRPWMAKTVKDVIGRGRQVFGRGDGMNLKRVQKELKRVVGMEREECRARIEHRFTQNDVEGVWGGVGLVGGCSRSSGSGSCLPDAGLECAGGLSEFCGRFGRRDFREGVCDLGATLGVGVGSGSESVLQVSEHEVCGEFLGLGGAGSAGPDGVTPGLLGLCAGQLAKIFAIVFNLSFRAQLVPGVWGRSCVVPVPEGPVISCMDGLGPVALASVPVEVCEGLFGEWLGAFVGDCIGPFRFAYGGGRGCAGAVLVMLEKLCHHAGRAGGGDSVGMMFFDFSSAFGTIRPRLLVQRLPSHNVPGSVLAWILGYLTDRSQYVRMASKRALSHCLQSGAGAPRGAVLAPFLFTLCASDCRSGGPSCPLIKFADDAAMIGLVGDNDDAICRRRLAVFVNHCDADFLELGVSGAKGVIVDFRVSCSPPGSVVLRGGGVGRVSSCRCLGIMMDDGLAWRGHIVSSGGSASGCAVSGGWIVFMLTGGFLLCFANPSLLVFGGIVCYVGVGALVGGAGTK